MRIDEFAINPMHYLQEFVSGIIFIMMGCTTHYFASTVRILKFNCFYISKIYRITQNSTGLIRMKKALTSLFLYLSFSFIALGNPTYIKEAEMQAQAWLSKMDDANVDESWQDMSTIFSQQLTKQDWDLSIQGMHGYFGKPGERKHSKSLYKTTSFNAPDGDYVDVTFSTDYANTPGRTEIVTMVKESERVWKVAGFSIE